MLSLLKDESVVSPVSYTTHIGLSMYVWVEGRLRFFGCRMLFGVITRMLLTLFLSDLVGIILSTTPLLI